ncbi:MAG: HPr family phosphocarrier protein [Paenibacillus macerans]|uniref:HPr family phosphocarrier protein n=1 Tax=Paenibacillus macerans TaxID=44252 RepID=A0A090ZEH9_PAEMA|nr:HPr family phosphocarrier protein [Paenibacillus macerans]KFN09729.1 PTS HPr component phosphorylation site family protein [Paenibacillus macerans]MBS5911684.1 HPr family phosphocarrier protein [Paenibacillus macerans]MCY7560313.1 HPr family phosphocarrier protein [Paenibacillus macerans]MDU5945926.1 HPr family phosphocarrier protein [Paenibacillus macerans]MDU7474525.1 HPr family phosphocarrier protein [Paenibacillus macerans]
MATNNEAVVEIAQAAGKFTSSIVLQADNKYIDVKSILGLFTTLVNTMSYELHVHGPDADEAKKAMSEVFAKHGLNVKLVED